VDALGGAPGVYSARYAGEHASDADNNAKLLAALAGTTSPRMARYRAVLVLVRDPDDPNPLVAEGVWEGEIAQQPSGGGGFGYDPLFLVDAGTRTSAELDSEEKNRRSHRGIALRRLLQLLQTS
jgi:XTP/dITP diphosphohydrolase